MPLTNPYPGPRSVIVMDNCNIHHGEEIRELIEDRGCTFHCYMFTYCLGADLSAIW